MTEDCTPEQWEGLANYGAREARIGTVVKLAREGGYKGHLLGTLGLRAEIQEQIDLDNPFPRELHNIHDELSELHHVRRMLERHAFKNPAQCRRCGYAHSCMSCRATAFGCLGTTRCGDYTGRRRPTGYEQVVEHRDLIPGFVNNDKAFADTVKAFRATERNRACREGIRLAGSMIAHWEEGRKPTPGVRQTHTGKKIAAGRRSALSRLRKRRG